MGKIIRNTLILTIITVVAGLGLGLVYEVTKEPIARTEEQAKKEAWQTVFSDVSLEDFKAVEVQPQSAIIALTLDGKFSPEADKTVADLGIKATVDEVCEAADEGYVVTVTDKEGYGGDIQITVGVTKDGTVSGVSILSISETAGLGMRATEAKFQEQYVGKNTDKFYVSKDGGEGEPIDAISGATITSRAFTGAVNTAIGYCKNAFQEGS